MTPPTSLSADISAHYDGAYLLSAIRVGIEALGKTQATVTIADLAPVDEFHVGGRQATDELCRRLDVADDSRVLDIGCGIGGTARYIADRYGCTVTGIDLTPEFVAVARTLTDWVGLTDLVRFETGDATHQPFDDASFDRAVQLHVGMNITDKAALFAEVHRVLRPGGRFALYDIMQTADGDLSYPVPWATDGSTSFVATADTHRRALEQAGFEITEQSDRRDFAIEFIATMQAKTAPAAGPPPLGLHLIIGRDTPTKVANMASAFTDGRLAPVQMICRKPE